MIRLNNVSKLYQTNIALDKVNLEISQGECVSIIGPSGSGKTTLLKLLNAQHLASSGELFINGEDVSTLTRKQLKHLRSAIAYIPQDLGLVPSLKVFQNVLLGKIGKVNTLAMLRRFLIPNQSELAKIHEILERVGIPEKLYDSTTTLSGGQQQRVAVARALYQDAHTILADEPVSAVDPARAKSLILLLKNLSLENQLTVVMSIHNIGLAQEHFPRIIGIREGKLQLDSSTPSKDELQDLFELHQTSSIG